MIPEVLLPVDAVFLQGTNRVTAICVREGDAVTPGLTLAEIKTASATILIDADCNGVVRKVLVEEGGEIGVSEGLMAIEVH